MREGGKRLRRLGLAAVFVLAVSATPALSQAIARPVVCPPHLGDGWTIDSRKASASMAHGCAASRRSLKETEANVHAVVIARHGKLVFEQYFPGL